MANLMRYIDANPQNKPTVRKPKQASQQTACPQCNYSNNYYGDQVCSTASR